jgi:hypothetical protein
MMIQPKLMPAVAVAEQAELLPASALPDLMHQSLPVPVRGGKSRLQLLFFYGNAEMLDPKVGVQLWPPTYVALMNALTGRFEELRTIKVGDYRQRHAPDKPFGTLPDRGGPECLNRKINWYKAYDMILPCFAAGNYGLTPEQQAAARDFSRLWPELVEAPLLPYYEAAASEFFDWLKLMK